MSAALRYAEEQMVSLRCDCKEYLDDLTPVQHPFLIEFTGLARSLLDHADGPLPCIDEEPKRAKKKKEKKKTRFAYEP